MTRLTPILCILVLIGICLAFSKDRQAALRRWSLIAWAIGLQLVFAMIILRTDLGRGFFALMNAAFVAVINSTQGGAGFVFGPNLTDPSKGLGFFAFFVLPTIIFFSALTAMLYHLHILQFIVKGIAWVMTKTLKTSGAETLSASANIFVGQTEAPLLVRPFVPTMTNSELMTVMTGGFATVAGGVMAAYVAMLIGAIPDIAGHLLACSVMSAPAALMFGKLFVPETERPVTAGTVNIDMSSPYDNVVDAVAGGASEGVKLALNVGGMLIAFLAIIFLLNTILGKTTGWIDWPAGMGIAPGQGLTIELILGYIFYPLGWLMGIPQGEVLSASRFLGIKMAANEFVAYQMFSEAAMELSPRTRIILSYALCGFANLGSIGIQIGGLSIMAPERRADLARLGFPAMIAGTFATTSSACVAAILIDPDTASVVDRPVQVDVIEDAEQAPLDALQAPDELGMAPRTMLRATDEPWVFVVQA